MKLSTDMTTLDMDLESSFARARRRAKKKPGIAAFLAGVFAEPRIKKIEPQGIQDGDLHLEPAKEVAPTPVVTVAAKDGKEERRRRKIYLKRHLMNEARKARNGQTAPSAAIEISEASAPKASEPTPGAVSVGARVFDRTRTDGNNRDVIIGELTTVRLITPITFTVDRSPDMPSLENITKGRSTELLETAYLFVFLPKETRTIQ